MDSSLRSRGYEFRGDGFHRVGLGWRLRNEEIVKRGSRARGTARSESVHKKTIYHRQSSAEVEHYVAALGASEWRGVECMICGKMKHIDVAHLWLQDEVKSNSLKVR